MEHFSFTFAVKQRETFRRLSAVWVIILPLIVPWGRTPDNLLSICVVQGSRRVSPFNHQPVRLRGVVYADLDERPQAGFYLQTAYCDDDPHTSDGIFIHLNARRDLVQVGDLVEVSGVVQEYFGRTEVAVIPELIWIISRGNALPAASLLEPPANPVLLAQYYETLEDMRVSLPAARVVGPSEAGGHTWVVALNLGLERVFLDDSAGLARLVCVEGQDSNRIVPAAKNGDQLLNLEGALDFSMGLFCLHLTVPADLLPGNLLTWPDPAVLAGAGDFSMATFNLKNFFDTLDDPATDDSVLSAAVFQRRLHKYAETIHSVLRDPEILAVQEAENLAVLQALVAQPELGGLYRAWLVEGPDLRGLDVGLLYRVDRVLFLESAVYQGCTTLVDGLGPDGNQLLDQPANARTCDSNGDGILDGNRLFARPILAVRLAVCPGGCSGTGDSADTLWLLIAHLKSKIEDTSERAYTQPRRTLQAQFTAALAMDLSARQEASHLVVMGDLNDPIAAPTLASLADYLADSWQLAVPSQRYSYIYQGISQPSDHILLRLGRRMVPVACLSFPINADYPYTYETANSFYRSSDHDPLLVRLRILEKTIYLPILDP